MEPSLSIQDEYLECIVNEQLNISLQVQPPTRDNIVAFQKSRFEDQDKTIDYIVA
jgi:hypothetical protein